MTSSNYVKLLMDCLLSNLAVSLNEVTMIVLEVTLWSWGKPCSNWSATTSFQNVLLTYGIFWMKKPYLLHL